MIVAILKIYSYCPPLYIRTYSCKSPIICTILEEVCDGHGCVRETMNKKCFKDTFQIMKCPTSGCDTEISKSYYDSHIDN